MSAGASALLQAWRHTCREACGALVLPDGCIDLIGLQVPGQAPSWKLSALIDRACRVQAPTGQRYAGFRLQPGAQVNASALLCSVESLELDDASGVLERLDASVALDTRVTEALQALACESGVRQAQTQLGVSERSLQRLLATTTDRSPLYWRRLARLRRSVRALHGGLPLAQIAAEQGYADQSHMNLEFQRWLGLTPLQAQRKTELVSLLGEPGYG